LHTARTTDRLAKSTASVVSCMVTSVGLPFQIEDTALVKSEFVGNQSILYLLAIVASPYRFKSWTVA
jgi:hypothetical protein